MPVVLEGSLTLKSEVLLDNGSPLVVPIRRNESQLLSWAIVLTIGLASVFAFLAHSGVFNGCFGLTRFKVW